MTGFTIQAKSQSLGLLEIPKWPAEIFVSFSHASEVLVDDVKSLPLLQKLSWKIDFAGRCKVCR